MPTAFRCEIISWKLYYNLSYTLALKIKKSGFTPNVIIAIGRGGYMPARLLSDFLDITDLNQFRVEHYTSSQKHTVAKIKTPFVAEKKGQRILLIDDVSDTGNTFEIAINHLNTEAAPREIRTAVLHHKTTSKYVPDFYAKKIIKWRWIIYPWALYEDIGAFIKKVDYGSHSLNELVLVLEHLYDVKISERELRRILFMIKK